MPVLEDLSNRFSAAIRRAGNMQRCHQRFAQSGSFRREACEDRKNVVQPCLLLVVSLWQAFLARNAAAVDRNFPYVSVQIAELKAPFLLQEHLPFLPRHDVCTSAETFTCVVCQVGNTRAHQDCSEFVRRLKSWRVCPRDWHAG